MSPLTSANWESFYNSFFHEKRTVSRGIEPMTSNLKLSTQCTEPSSLVKSISLTLSQILRFLDKPTNHFFCLGWWQPPWSTYPWVSSWIPAMNLWRSANLLLYRSFYNSFLYKKKFYQFWAWTPGFQSPAQNLIHWVTKPCTGKVSQTQPLSWILGLKHFSMPWLFHER